MCYLLTAYFKFIWYAESPKLEWDHHYDTSPQSLKVWHINYYKVHQVYLLLKCVTKTLLQSVKVITNCNSTFGLLQKPVEPERGVRQWSRSFSKWRVFLSFGTISYVLLSKELERFNILKYRAKLMFLPFCHIFWPFCFITQNYLVCKRTLNHLDVNSF